MDNGNHFVCKSNYCAFPGLKSSSQSFESSWNYGFCCVFYLEIKTSCWSIQRFLLYDCHLKRFFGMKQTETSLWNVLKYEAIVVVDKEGLPGLCFRSRWLRFAWKLIMCASPRVSHAILIALQRGLGHLMAAGHNVFGPVCQRDHLPPNKMWKTSGGKCTGSLSMWEDHFRNILY